MGSRKVEAEKKVPIEVVTDSKHIVSGDYPNEVSFRLAGPKAFLRVVLDRRETPIRVDLTRRNAGVVRYRLFSDMIDVPINVRVVSVQPAEMIYRLEKLVTKRVPVSVELSGYPSEGLSLESFEIIPKEVLVKGPQSHLKDLRVLKANPVDIEGMRENAIKELSFDTTLGKIAIDDEIPKVNILFRTGGSIIEEKNE